MIDNTTVRTDNVYKITGVTLNYNASQVVNFEIIRYMILETGKEEPAMTVHTERKINHKRNGGVNISIITEPEYKMYRISFYKR